MLFSDEVLISIKEHAFMLMEEWSMCNMNASLK